MADNQAIEEFSIIDFQFNQNSQIANPFGFTDFTDFKDFKDFRLFDLQTFRPSDCTDFTDLKDLEKSREHEDEALRCRVGRISVGGEDIA